MEATDFSALFRTADSGDVRSFTAGETVFRQGEIGSELFVIRSGSVAIDKDGRELERLGVGGMFGELALVDNEPRNATVTAMTDCELVAIDEYGFQRLVRHNPFFALAVLRLLAGRLRAQQPDGTAVPEG